MEALQWIITNVSDGLNWMKARAKPKCWWHWIVFSVFWLCMFIHLVTRLFGKTADFATFWWAGRLLLKGKDIYTPVQGVMPYVYPPFFAVLMIPFSLLPQKIAYLLWQLGQIIGLAWSYYELEKILFEKADSQATDRLWLTLLLWSPFVIDNWRVGQSNHLQLICLTAMTLFLTQRKQKEAGFMLGLAIATKPFFLAPVLIWLVIKRLWWNFFTCIVTATVLIWFIPILILGSDGVKDLFLRWYEQASTTAAGGLLMTARDKSLTSSLYRLLTPVNVSLDPNQPVFVNWLNLSPQIAMAIVLIIGITIATVTFWHCYRCPTVETDNHRLVWEIGLILNATMLLLPLIERHHCLLMLPTFLWLANSLISDIQCANRFFISLVAIGWFLYGLVDLLPKHLSLHFCYWAHSIGLLFVFVAMLKLAKNSCHQSKGLR